MLRITVEVVPFGDENYTEVIRRVAVWNDGPTEERERHDPGGERMYRFETTDDKEPVASGSIKHRRRFGALALASGVLSDIAQQQWAKELEAESMNERAER